MFLNRSSFFWIWCKIVLGVKLSAVSNCPFLYVVSNCPVSNCPVSNCPVSNCPRCQIVRGVKLSAVSNCPVSNCPGVKLSANMGGVKLSAVSNCPGVKLSRHHIYVVACYKMPSHPMLSKYDDTSNGSTKCPWSELANIASIYTDLKFPQSFYFLPSLDLNCSEL